jgi:uncharacterized paraquat-inducible protein A
MWFLLVTGIILFLLAILFPFHVQANSLKEIKNADLGEVWCPNDRSLPFMICVIAFPVFGMFEIIVLAIELVMSIKPFLEGKTLKNLLGL